jgi:mono/diheme cytochrome c family protein
MRIVVWTSVGLLAGCEGGTTNACTGGTSRTADIVCLQGDASNGAAVFSDNCAVCHGADAAGINGLGSDIRGKVPEDTIDSILNPVAGMTDLSNVLSDQEIADVAAHVETL